MRCSLDFLAKAGSPLFFQDPTMTIDAIDAASTPQPQPQHPVKRTYIKPEFQREAVFETMALACGKIRGTQGQCRRVSSNS